VKSEMECFQFQLTLHAGKGNGKIGREKTWGKNENRVWGKKG